MNQKILLKSCISIALISLAFGILYQNQYINLLKEISIFDILLCCVLTILIMATYGLNFSYFLKKQHHNHLNLLDIINFPLMINFWGFIIPIRGGMIYSILFLKAKYNIKIIQGTAMTIYLYTVGFAIMGLFGLGFVFKTGNLFSPLTLISLILLFNPFIIRILNIFFQKITIKKNLFLRRVKEFIHSLLTDSQLPWKNIRTTAIITAFILLRYFFLALRYYWAGQAFDISIPFSTIIILTLVIEFSDIVIRILPGNIGISEFLAGGVFHILGQETEEGILIALFIRFSVLLPTFTLGSLAVFMNMKYFKVTNFKSLWNKIKTT